MEALIQSDHAKSGGETDHRLLGFRFYTFAYGAMV